MTNPPPDTPDTIRIVIPLTLKRRNGRPRIVPPEHCELMAETGRADPKLMRAIGRAWSWRRKLDRGEAATLSDIAEAEKVTLAFISRRIRLAYLAPTVLEMLLVHRRPCSVSIDKLTAVALAPWAEQPGMVFEDWPSA